MEKRAAAAITTTTTTTTTTAATTTNRSQSSAEMVVKVAHLEKQRNELRLFYWCLMKAVATTVAAAALVEKIGHIVARSEGRLKKLFFQIRDACHFYALEIKNFMHLSHI